jgi:hypothetical protein
MKSTVMKKLSVSMVTLMIISILSPVLAFAGAYFKDINYAANGTVTGQVYFDGTVGTTVYGSGSSVTVSVYDRNGNLVTTTTATYSTYTNGAYYYSIAPVVTSATYSVYNPIQLKIVSHLLTAPAVSDFVYKQALPPFVSPGGSTGGGGGGGTTGSALDATSGTISASALKSAFASASTVEIKIKETLAIPASALVDAAKKADAKLVITGENGTYELPLSVLDLDALAKAVGVAVDDLKINVGITKLTGTSAKAVTDAATAIGASPLSDAVDFTLVAEGKDGKKFVIDSFGDTYVKRTIKLNKAASETATAVLYNPTLGTFSFVPSTFSDTTATFLRTGNSVYVAIENTASFDDVAGHWAQDDIELLASKLVVDGVGAGKFEAERDITRAEFAALAVKSLGLNVSSVVTDTYFDDVDADEWYAGYIAAAQEAGLVDGYEDGTFKPEQDISREELSALVVRALKYAGVDTAVTAAKQAAALAKFSDADEIVWAQVEVATAIELSIVNGVTDTTLDVTANATRAESATMLKRLLSKAGFIE